jgi:hypothetical protein
MGDIWRQIFENPKEIEDVYVRDNYVLEREIIFPASENYEKIEGRAILLRKKN